MDSRREALCARKASRRCIGESVGAALQRMSIVASEPLPTNAKLRIQVDKLRPELSMVDWQTAPVFPFLATPSKDETSHPMNQKLGIGIQLNLCSAWNRAKSFYRREKFHLRNRGPGTCAGHFPPLVPLDQDCAPSAGTGIADRRAIREDANDICHLEAPGSGDRMFEKLFAGTGRLFCCGWEP
jgi:hypothetical protein